MKKMILILLLALFHISGAYAGQTCQTDSIVASTPTSRFASHGDGTVTDEGTGLTWKVCSEGQSYNSGGCDGMAIYYTWQGALQQAKAVNTAGFAGQHNWRLPNLKELQSIVERQCIAPAVNLKVFPLTPLTLPSVFWSASPHASLPANGRLVDFNDGYDTVASKDFNFGHVRLVRGR